MTILILHPQLSNSLYILQKKMRKNIGDDNSIKLLQHCIIYCNLNAWSGLSILDSCSLLFQICLQIVISQNLANGANCMLHDFENGNAVTCLKYQRIFYLSNTRRPSYLVVMVFDWFSNGALQIVTAEKELLVLQNGSLLDMLKVDLAELLC